MRQEKLWKMTLSVPELHSKGSIYLMRVFLCLRGVKGCKQMDRPEQGVPNADGQNNYLPLYDKPICICHCHPDPFS